MITKIGFNYNCFSTKLNGYSDRKQTTVPSSYMSQNMLKDSFISFTGEKKDYQREKLDNILKYADSSTKKMLKDVWVDARNDGYNTITPLHIVRNSLKEVYEYIEDLDSGVIEYNASDKPDMAAVISAGVHSSIFSNKDLRKKIKPVIKTYLDHTNNLIKENKPKDFAESKKLSISNELLDYIWSYRGSQTETITPNVVLSATLSDDANDEIIDMVEDLFGEISEKTMLNDTPLSKRAPFSGYEDRAKNILKNMSLGTNMFLTYDKDKESPQSFLDTVHKVVEKEYGNKLKVLEFNSMTSESFLSEKLNEVRKDKKQNYLLLIDPTSVIVNFTPAESIAESRFAVPMVINQLSNQLPANANVLYYDTKNNYYTFSDVANFSEFQETSIPALSSEQMIKYFKENSNLLKKLKTPFTKSAAEKAIIASAQIDGVFPQKTTDLMKKIISYNITKKEITDKDVNGYLKEATDLLKKSNDDSSVEVRFDTGKHLKQMTGKASTRKEAEQIVKQIKSKKLGTKGIIIYSQDGSPGSGRKFTAQAIAGDAKVPYIEINTMDFGTKDVEIFGGSLSPEASMKKLFSLVKTQAESNPNKSAVLFIENFEYFSIGELVSHYHQKAMAQLLREMEKADEAGLNILVAGSVSNPDLIGEATMKSFKFVDSIEVASPAINKSDREKIIQQALKEYKIKTVGDKEKLEIIKFTSDITDGFPYIQLKNLMKKSKSVAEERNHKKLTKADVTEAYLQLTTGRPSTNKLAEHEKIMTTSHECGHATNLTVMNNIARNYGKTWHVPSKVNFVTLDPRGTYGGAVYHGSDINDETSFETAFSELVCAFGGNSAEKHFFGMDGSWGITADMDFVRRLSSAMVKRMGFGAQVGKMNVGLHDDLSDNMKQMVESDQRVIINNAKMTSELITEIYEDFNKWFTDKYSPLVGTGDCMIDGDEFRNALQKWRSNQSPEKQRELELCDRTILKIIEATKNGIAVRKEH